MYTGDVCGIVWSEKAGADFSIHHTHPMSMGKTPALCSWLNKKKKKRKKIEKNRKKNLAHVMSLRVFKRTVWRREIKTSQERLEGCAQT